MPHAYLCVATRCRMVGQPLALAKALGECSKIIRANPPKEKPGGCPPSLSRITGGLRPHSCTSYLQVVQPLNRSCGRALQISDFKLNTASVWLLTHWWEGTAGRQRAISAQAPFTPAALSC